MRSATDFLPAVINTFTNFATSLLPYLGSGRISRLGISLRLGIHFSVRRKVKTYFSPVVLPSNRCSVTDTGQLIRCGSYYAAFGFLAPYFDRLCFLSLTPAVSR